MEEAAVRIAVNGASRSEVEALLRECMGPAFFDSKTPHVCGLHLRIEDLTAEFAYTKTFLAEHGLENSSLAEKLVDLEGFNVEVELSGDRRYFGVELDSVLGDRLAQYISDRLGRRVALLVDGGEIPFRVYASGSLERDFAEYYKGYLSQSAWIPRPQ